MFAEMMDFFGPENVNGIDGEWFASDEIRDNLDSFDEGIRLGMTREDAALGTFTWKMAAEWGYTSVTSVEMIGSPGNYLRVSPQFRRPEGP